MKLPRLSYNKSIFKRTALFSLVFSGLMTVAGLTNRKDLKKVTEQKRDHIAHVVGEHLDGKEKSHLVEEAHYVLGESQETTQYHWNWYGIDIERSSESDLTITESYRIVMHYARKFIEDEKASVSRDSTDIHDIAEVIGMYVNDLDSLTRHIDEDAEVSKSEVTSLTSQGFASDEAGKKGLGKTNDANKELAQGRGDITLSEGLQILESQGIKVNPEVTQLLEGVEKILTESEIMELESIAKQNNFEDAVAMIRAFNEDRFNHPKLESMIRKFQSALLTITSKTHIRHSQKTPLPVLPFLLLPLLSLKLKRRRKLREENINISKRQIPKQFGRINTIPITKHSTPKILVPELPTTRLKESRSKFSKIFNKHNIPQPQKPQNVPTKYRKPTRQPRGRTGFSKQPLTTFNPKTGQRSLQTRTGQGKKKITSRKGR